MSPADIIVALAWLAAILGNRDVWIPAVGMATVILRGLTLRIVNGLDLRKIEWAIVLFLGYWLLNYSWSTADLQNLYSFDFLRRDGALLVTYPLFLMLLGWRLKPKLVRGFWTLFVTCLALLAIPGAMLALYLPHPLFFEDLHVVGFDYSVGQDMFFGWYEAHNTSGGVYAIAAIFALALLQEPSRWKRKMFLWFLFLASTTGLVFTFSRGGYLSLLAGALLILPVRKLGRLMKIALLAVVPTVALVMMTSRVLDRIDTITDPYYGTNAYRLEVWGDAIGAFELSPLVGIGFGRFNDRMVQFKGVKHLVWVGVHGEIVNNDAHAHNSYLHFLAEGGIIGLALSLYIWWCAWTELSLFIQRFQGTALYSLCKAARACLVGGLAMSCTEHILGRGSVILVLMGIVGMTLACARREWAVAKAERERQKAAPSLASRSRRVSRLPVPAA
ncbi:MAG TPA: O-antigen ligase family protein [Terriglobia bacterium]|nr:O-antigen ligase family protein [Terriglobia bacterium]